MNNKRAVLFDLDGTLLDTVSDILYALNVVRLEENLPELPLGIFRPAVNLGSKAMIKLAFEMDDTHVRFPVLREKFLGLYEKHLANTTQFFPHVETLLTYLENKNIPWGIVTNKLTKYTSALLKALRMEHRPACVVCGDSLSTHKPDPAPVRYACELLKLQPRDCLFIGDAMTDVEAGKAAGATSLVALYGYISHEEDPLNWKADGYIKQAMEIIDWL